LIDGPLVPSLVDGVEIGLAKVPASNRENKTKNDEETAVRVNNKV
jgi:hypothetical protein